MKRHYLLLLAAALLAGAFPRYASAQQTGMEAALALESTLVNAIKSAEESVVAIARVRKAERGAPGIGRFGEEIPASDPRHPDFVPNSYGTGVVVDADGLILTNYHVLGDPKEYDYYVWTHHRAYPARKLEQRKAIGVEAADPWLDLAVLKIDAHNLKRIKFGDAEKLEKGQIVIALGNPHAIARDGDVSATWGIVSNLNRAAAPLPGMDERLGKDTLHHYGTLIQTDAKLPQGCSGGALINLKGEMVGLTTSLAALSKGETTAGFAIPVNEAFKNDVEKLKHGQRADFGFLGVQPEFTQDGGDGLPAVRITDVVAGTPAQKAGLGVNDIVTHIDGRRVYNGSDLIREIGHLGAGEDAKLTVIRSGRPAQTIVVRLSKKYLNTTRPPIARVEDPAWRGMQVDYATAIPPETLQLRAAEIDLDGCVAVVAVKQDSPAWKAGIRRWTLISHVGETQVDDPEAFFRAVNGRNGQVELRLSGSNQVRAVPAQ